MSIHKKQLIRLGELIGLSADALRDLITVHAEESETQKLCEVAADLDRLASIVSEAGRSSISQT